MIPPLEEAPFFIIFIIPVYLSIRRCSGARVGGELGLISHRSWLYYTVTTNGMRIHECQLLEVVLMLFAYKKVGWGG